ncbi:MAG: hypothetical protein GQ470_06530 [Gammaproteobacteria bacterium]|nr:hypothetical protein [Gammaproteobacteria bacterium]
MPDINVFGEVEKFVVFTMDGEHVKNAGAFFFTTLLVMRISSALSGALRASAVIRDSTMVFRFRPVT